MADLSNLQEMLNDRADTKLSDEIHQLFSGWVKFWYGADNLTVKITFGGPESKAISIGEVQRILESQLFDAHRQKYREAEVRDFLAQADAFRDSLNELADQVARG